MVLRKFIIFDFNDLIIDQYNNGFFFIKIKFLFFILFEFPLASIIECITVFPCIRLFIIISNQNEKTIFNS